MKHTKEKVLALLKQSTTILSGEALAKELGVSRTAIWKAIRELDRLGYQIEHLANGYRFLSSNVLEAEEIAFEQLPESHIHIHKTVDSTMNIAKLASMQAKATPIPALFLAEEQSQTRGRFGRAYFAPKGQIYMTLLLRPYQTFEELPQYTLLAAVAVAAAIDELTGKTTRIKWVNDLYLGDKKVCGILSEAMSDFETGQISYVAIGIGLNFAIPTADFPKELQAKATSLFPDEEPTTTRNELIQRIWKNFFELLEGLPDTAYLEYYRRKSFVLGKTVTFTQQGQEYTGRAVRISDKGELIVETPQGLKPLSSGEISLSQIQK
ncbi:biotin--[acetyl-CoA-carboxylase] ligase [Enterococcus sp. LJL98]